MKSCLYFGAVAHWRFQPKWHAFRFRLFMLYLDLAELDRVFEGRWFWSSRQPSLAWFRRADHAGDPNRPLSDEIRDLVATETGCRPGGPIRLLTHLRYFGYCFNPISIYYCFDPAGQRLEALVAEVTNTPWKERRLYVLAGATPQESTTQHRFSKTLHVSPFMPMELEYLWRSNIPDHRLTVHMEVLRGDSKLFDASLALQRKPITGRNLAAALARYPFMTLKVIAAIHWEALWLWLKGVPIFDHPSDTRTAGVSAPTKT